MQGNLLPITLKSMRILINNVNRKLTYTKNWPFFVLSCSGVRNGIIRQERIRGIVEGGNIQLLSKRHCLPRSPEEEGGLAGATTLSKEPPEYNIPSALEPQDITYPTCCFSLTGLLPPSLTGETPGSLRDSVPTTPTWWWAEFTPLGPPTSKYEEWEVWGKCPYL